MNILCLVATIHLAAAPTAQQVLDNAKKASGGDAWAAVTSAHQVGSIATSGLKGSQETWEDVRTGRYMDRAELGPLTQSEGFDGKVAWSVDPSNQVLEPSDAETLEATRNEAYRRSHAFWYPERWPADIRLAGEKTEGQRRFYVVSLTPRGGRPFEFWVDASTWLLDRTVEKASLETRTTFLSDYRTVQGVKMPFSTRGTNGDAKYDVLTTSSKIELNLPVVDGRFAKPPPPPPDYAFAGGATSTTVPFELVNNHIYLDVKVNGAAPMRVLCDTGGQNILTPTALAQLGLKPEGALQGHGVGEATQDVGLLKVKTLQVGDVTLTNQPFATLALEPFLKVEGFSSSGLIGYEVFRRFVVTVDYERRQLTLTRPSAFNPVGKGTPVPFRFKDQIPQVDGDIDGVAGVFDLDTGSRASIDLLAPFVEKHALAAKYAPRVEGVTGWGLGGASRSQVTRAKVLHLGSLEIREPVTELSLQKKGAFSDPYVAGNVGGGVLKRFTLTFDYEHKMLYAAPNALYAARDVFDRSGLWVNTGDIGLDVVDVMAAGPAAKAGLKVGDRVTAVEGKAVDGNTLLQLRTRFRSEPAGTQIHLTLASGGHTRQVVLVLEDLV